MRAWLALLIVLAVVWALPVAADARTQDAHLASYGGYATTELVVIRGRVGRGKPVPDKPERGKVRKVLATARAFLGRELEHARLRIVHDGVATPFVADEEGFFEARVSGKLIAGKQKFQVLLDEPRFSAPPLDVELEVVDGTRGLVVVTDIDDTLIDTRVTGGKMALIKRIARSDARDIRALDGAAEALRAFAAEGVPIVYVSASPVQLGPRLMQFLALAQFPSGALFLRHYESDGTGDPTPYKQRRFTAVLADFPGRKLVLFGDNGEHDIDIFRTLARDTGRVHTVYIRRTLRQPPVDGVELFDRWSEVLAHARSAGVLLGAPAALPR